MLGAKAEEFKQAENELMVARWEEHQEVRRNRQS